MSDRAYEQIEGICPRAQKEGQALIAALKAKTEAWEGAKRETGYDILLETIEETHKRLDAVEDEIACIELESRHDTKGTNGCSEKILGVFFF